MWVSTVSRTLHETAILPSFLGKKQLRISRIVGGTDKSGDMKYVLERMVAWVTSISFVTWRPLHVPLRIRTKEKRETFVHWIRRRSMVVRIRSMRSVHCPFLMKKRSFQRHVHQEHWGSSALLRSYILDTSNVMVRSYYWIMQLSHSHSGVFPIIIIIIIIIDGRYTRAWSNGAIRLGREECCQNVSHMTSSL